MHALSATSLAIAAAMLPNAWSSPVQPAARAGGPIAKPIPATCTLETMTPQGASGSVPGTQSYAFDNPDQASADGFGPTEAFRGAQTSYSYFLEDDSAQAGWNESAHIQECLQQCYGFGGPCSGIAWAHNVPGNVYGYNVSELACLFFAEPIESSDLAPITNGSWTQAVAVNIVC